MTCTPFAFRAIPVAVLLLAGCSPASPPAPSASPAATAAPAQFTPAALVSDCGARDGWSDPARPARITGDLWYVGTCGITALLLAGDVRAGEGHVLIDTGPADASAAVLASIRAAGFDPRDVRWILATHEHDDHVGGIQALKLATGARVAALPEQAAALAAGAPSPDDPQHAIAHPFAPVTADRVLADGEVLEAAGRRITVHATPVHSPGSSSWTWQECADGRCTKVVYADSLTTISADDYRFADHADRRAGVARGLTAAAALQGDLLITPHPSASELFDRFAGKAPLLDQAAPRLYAARAAESFKARLSREAAGKDD